jgi:hypothetical protein
MQPGIFIIQHYIGRFIPYFTTRPIGFNFKCLYYTKLSPSQYDYIIITLLCVLNLISNSQKQRALDDNTHVNSTLR